MLNKINIYDSKGFTLVEMAIVVIISGFIFVPLMSVFIQKEIKDKQQQTVEYDKRIVKAIDFYVKQNGKYPCPASLASGPQNDGFGVENCALTGPVMFGAVPVRTLGLPAYMAANAQDWKYFYSVVKSKTEVANYNAAIINPITVIMPNGTVGASTDYILVNPGKDGKGSYSLYGAANILTCKAGENARDSSNCVNADTLMTNNNTYVDAPLYLTGSPGAAGYYDDKLSYGALSQSTDFWVAQSDDTFGQKKLIQTRLDGNVGVGTSSPDAKLTVDGDALVGATYDGRGGVVNVQSDVSAAEIEVENQVIIDTVVKASGFCVGQHNPSDGSCCVGRVIKSSGVYQCCANGAYRKESGELACKESSSTTACDASDEGNYYDGKQCCYRHETSSDGKCCTGADKITQYGTCDRVE